MASIKILGISAFYHDSATALIEDGVIIAAAQEERFTRIKHDSSFPAHAVRFCLDYAGFSLTALDAVVFYDKPFIKFERLLQTYYAFAPRGLVSFIAAMRVWVHEKLFFKRMLYRELQNIESFNTKKLRLFFTEHHLSHAASAFYPSPFTEAAILTIDGVGEWATASIGRGRGNELEIIKELHFPHSLGLFYSALTYYLGFTVNSGEYKVMGLAPYGNAESPDFLRFFTIIKEVLTDIKKDGSLWLNQDYFSYASGVRMVSDARWERLFGFPRRAPESALEQKHCDFALAFQRVTEEVVIGMAHEARAITGEKNICLAGGVALNCVANGRLLREKIFERIWIQPAAGDAGGALGAALAAHYIYFKKERAVNGATDAMQGAYLGPAFSDAEIEGIAKKYKAPYQKYDDYAVLSREVAALIAGGAVVGWFQGRMEWGPRALGNRSIFGDARNPDMQKKLNLKIKYREGFRPFAPSVLAEDAPLYFELETSSPYMLFVADVIHERRAALPEGYAALPLFERLYTVRSDIPAVTHIDFSARIQTVHAETNPRYSQLLNAFKDLTGYGLMVNTSFNVRGEPIVCTPDDAYRCFMRTEMDYLVMNTYVYAKSAQPALRKEWRDQFTPD